MTGNTALLAIAIGQGQLASALLSFLALVGFVFGVAAATAIYNPTKRATRAVLRPLFFWRLPASPASSQLGILSTARRKVSGSMR
jgi:uncharacterized membrane protein YoaK (UPF0700 family)